MDSVSQSLEASACAFSDRTATVVVDVERRGAVGGVERDAAGARATVLDHVRHRLAQCPGDSGLMRGIYARGGVVDADLDPDRPERHLGRGELNVDTRDVAPGDRLADVAYRLPRKPLYVRELGVGGPVALRAQPARQLGLDGDER